MLSGVWNLVMGHSGVGGSLGISYWAATLGQGWKMGGGGEPDTWKIV